MRALSCAVVILALVGQVAAAQNLSTRNRAKLFKSQTNILDQRASQQYSGSVRLKPAKVVTPTKWDGLGLKFKGQYKGPYLKLAKDAARKHGVPEDLFLRLIQQESGWNSKARSHKGAYGLAQLMPQTARQLGVDRTIPAQNLEGGARYLRMQYQTFGSWRLALAAYNAGPKAVEKYNGVPPYKETRNYVRVIWGS